MVEVSAHFGRWAALLDTTEHGEFLFQFLHSLPVSSNQGEMFLNHNFCSGFT